MPNLACRRRSARAAGPLPPRRMGRRDSPRCRRISTTRRRRALLATPHALRLHQDRRRLRSSLHVLRHPAICAGKFRSRRFESVVAEAQQLVAQRRARDHAHRAGHHLLRRRSRPEGRACRSARRGWRRSTACSWLRFLYAYPNKVTGAPARDHRQARQHLQVPRRAAAARLARRPEAHEARRAAPTSSSRLLEKVRRDRSRHRAPHHVHRRLSRRDRQRISKNCASSSARPSSTGWASSPTPTKKAPAPSRSTRPKFPKRTIEARDAPPDEAAAGRSAKQRQAAMGRPRDRILVEGESEETDTALGRPHRSSTRPRSMARSTSTTSAHMKRWNRDASTAPRSPRPTTTTWSRALSNNLQEPL